MIVTTVGMKVVATPNALARKRLWPDRHREGVRRSWRLWKKLRRKLGPEFQLVPGAFHFGNTLYVHPEIYARMQR